MKGRKKKLKKELKSNMKIKYFNFLIIIVISILIGLATYFTFFATNKNFNSSNNKERGYFVQIGPTFANQNYNKENYKTKIFQLEAEEFNDNDETPKLFLVEEVIDGDTFKLIDGNIVRLIGIDTPEKGKPYFEEAKNYLKNLIEGKYVFLEKDVSETDKYGRLLRYVWLPQDERSYIFVNLELINAGFAYAWSCSPDVLYSQELVTAQEEAKINKRGLWQ